MPIQGTHKIYVPIFIMHENIHIWREAI